MYRKFLYSSIAGTSFLRPELNPDTPTRSKYSEHLYKSDPNETGWDRLYNMYTKDEFGTLNPNMVSVVQAGMMGFFTGACIGGFLFSRNAYHQFTESNQATAFASHLDAKKKLQDAVTVNFAKGALKWGWRLGLFSSSYVLITTTIGVYRGKSGIIEYVTAGGLTGAAYKCNLGIRGVIVGGALGSVLGGIAGAISLAILKLTGTTMEEIRYWQYSMKVKRDGYMQKAAKEAGKEELGPLLIAKDKISEDSNTLDSITDESNKS